MLHTSLIETTLFGLLVTLACWEVAIRLNRKWPTPLLNPVMLSIVAIIALLLQLDLSYEQYNIGGQWLSFLLGPAVVSLAVPLVRQIRDVRANLLAIVAAIVVGSVTGIVVSSGAVLVLGGSEELARSMAPKSVTTPIALGISAQVGGLPPLTAALVILTGILGAMLGPECLRLVGVKDPLAIGLGTGAAAHGIGTSRVMADHPLSGAMSGIAMTLNGLITAIILPYLLPIVIRLLS